MFVHHGEHGLVAYRNTCAHRHAMLQPNGHGTQAQLTCQYHGWQYSAEGRVCRVPDGQSFKGVKTDQLRLHPLKAEICGPFVLVCFDQNAASFRQHLGEFSEEFDPVFGYHRHFAT